MHTAFSTHAATCVEICWENIPHPALEQACTFVLGANQGKSGENRKIKQVLNYGGIFERSCLAIPSYISLAGILYLFTFPCKVCGANFILLYGKQVFKTLNHV